MTRCVLLRLCHAHVYKGCVVKLQQQYNTRALQHEQKKSIKWQYHDSKHPTTIILYWSISTFFHIRTQTHRQRVRLPYMQPFSLSLIHILHIPTSMAMYWWEYMTYSSFVYCANVNNGKSLRHGEQRTEWSGVAEMVFGVFRLFESVTIIKYINKCAMK